MSNRIPVFDSWGNYVGYFTEASGCGSGAAILLLVLLIPLLAVFVWINIFRIAKRLLERKMFTKAILWIGMALYPFVVAAIYGIISVFGEFIGSWFNSQGIYTADTLPPTMQLLLLFLGVILFMVIPISVLVIQFIQFVLAFRYSSLDF